MKALSAVGLLVVLALSACSFPAWRDQMYRDLVAGTLHLDYRRIGPGGSGSETVELYDASGRHVGYGRVSGGTIEL